MQDRDVKKTRRPRDPEGTREAILEAAGVRLAKDGPEGFSVSEVAHLAGVNRGTAYQHFETRDKLIKATAEWVSEKMVDHVFGEAAQAGERNVEDADIVDITERLVEFAMDNPELCQGWLLHVLSSPEPLKDHFWREYAGSMVRFATTQLSQNDIDSEVFSVIMLSGIFLWPVWARAHARTAKDRRKLARRLAKECLRLSMYGSLRPEYFPEIVERLEADKSSAKSPKGRSNRKNEGPYARRGVV